MGLTSAKLFTTNTLAKHLGWMVTDGAQPSGKRPNKRFSIAFKVLTELFLTGAASADTYLRESLSTYSLADV